MRPNYAIDVFEFKYSRKGQEVNHCYTDLTKIHRLKGEGDLQELIENFEQFLRACGFCFNGSLEIITDEEDVGDNN